MDNKDKKAIENLGASSSLQKGDRAPTPAVSGSRLKIRSLNPPAGLSAALEHKWKDLGYRSIENLTLFHLVWLGGGPSGYLEYCGVFGDGANGVYEWFIFRNGKLETSNTQWGSDEWALREVLNKLEYSATRNMLEAAPELARAAQLACLMFERKNSSNAEADWMGDDEHEAWTALRKALAKARGEV